MYLHIEETDEDSRFLLRINGRSARKGEAGRQKEKALGCKGISKTHATIIRTAAKERRGTGSCGIEDIGGE